MAQTAHFTVATMGERIIVCADEEISQKNFDRIVQDLYGDDYTMGTSRKSFHSWMVTGRKKQA